MTDEELRQRSDFLTNTAYLVALALDLLVRESEKTLNRLTPAQGWKFEKKQMFTRFTDYVKKACLINEDIFKDVCDVEAKNKYKYLDVWQEEANELARFILMIGDRTSDIDTIQEIHAFIRSLPGDGNATEDLLNKFYMKKLN